MVTLTSCGHGLVGVVDLSVGADGCNSLSAVKNDTNFYKKLLLKMGTERQKMYPCDLQSL